MFYEYTLQDLSAEEEECFCGGVVKFCKMLLALKALVCSDTEVESSERDSRLIFDSSFWAQKLAYEQEYIKSIIDP